MSDIRRIAGAWYPMNTLGNAVQGMGWAALPFLLLPMLALLAPRTHGFALAVASVLDDASRGIGEVVKWTLPVLVLSVVFTVFMLSIFGWASIKMDESAVYLHAFALMLGASAALLADEHVRVDVLYARMSAQTQALVDFAGFYALLTPLMLVVVWESQSATAFSWAILEGSPDADGIRGRFLIKTLIPAFAVMMLAQGMAIAVRAAVAMREP